MTTDQQRIAGKFVGEEAFLTNTEEEALKEMEKRSNCRVWPCVCPTIGARSYCISENGELYGMRYVKMTKQYVCSIQKPRYDRHNEYFWYAICTTPDREELFLGEVLVWCTFVLGRWEPDVQLDFKDGNRLHVRLDNLETHKLVVPKLWGDRMKAWEDDYKMWFDYVAEFVAYKDRIRLDDAKDVAQYIFMMLVTQSENHKPISNFTGTWIHWAVVNGLHYHRELPKHCNIDDAELYIGTHDKPYELDLFGLVKNEKHRQWLRLYMEGNSQAEIAELYGTSEGTISTELHRVIKNLREHFKSEKHLYK